MRKRWGLALVLALVCVVLLCVGVSAETVAEGVCGDDLTWVLDDAGVLTISGSGEMEDYKSGSITPWYSYRNDITTVIIEEGVTSIGNHAFDNFDTINCFYPLLTSVQLPGTLVSIGEYALYCCVGVTSITLPEGLSAIKLCAFQNCTGLTSLVLPEGLTSIGNAAFKNCSALTEITLQGNASISTSAFVDADLQTVHISNAVTTVYSSIFSLSTVSAFDVDDIDGVGFVSIDGVLYSHDDSADAYTLVRYPAAKKDGEYTIVDGTTAISTAAISYNPYLDRLNVADSVTTIGTDNFENCKNLSTLRWGANVTSTYIAGCSNSPVTTVILPKEFAVLPKPYAVTDYKVINDTDEGYRDIDGVLYYYDAKEDILTVSCYPQGRTDASYTIADGTDVIGEYAFYNINKYLTSVQFPDSVTEIDSDGFYGCSKLTNVDLNEGLITIGSGAFRCCTALAEIRIPQTVTTIKRNAFRDCTSLTQVSFPPSITSIGLYAFYCCSALREAYFYGDAPHCEVYAFSNTHSTFTIYYIAGKSGWTSPTWNGYKTATFVPAGNSLTLTDSSTYVLFDETITNVSIGTTVSAFVNQFSNAGITVSTPAGVFLSDTDLVGTGCVVSLTVDGAVVDTLTIVVTGDLSGDGLSDRTDLALLQQYYCGYNVTIDYPAAADLNGDGKMTRADAMVLARWLAGWTDAMTPPSDDVVIIW